ncbi:UNVERIFIED_CONTAM: hypothetical protein Scaly_1240800 [Sesamum calycinum]|uniref:Uncharacterized protein n=1 Tax=Sesamum calycinum TaxID=2727403 RepID=A0AAW2Q568_9LAMI
MEKEPRKQIFGAAPALVFLLSLSMLCVCVDFFWGNTLPFDRWVQYFSASEAGFRDGKAVNETLEEQEFIRFHLGRLVRGEDRRDLDATGFACDRAVHSIVCVSNKHVRIDTRNMTVYIPSDQAEHETIVRPYARQEDELKVITPVRMLQYRNTTVPPECQYNHNIPGRGFLVRQHRQRLP